ncbi:hypothetical protein [Chryseobacterium indologenes]|uniref:hypothetical protein n=1 Tax=Chryseobacterium indologenes TaxID=253 RepID=UPI004058D2B2
MRKFRLTLSALAPDNQGGNIDFAKFVFHAENSEKANLFKDELLDLYEKSPNPFKNEPPFPRQHYLQDITNEEDDQAIVHLRTEW